MNSKEFLRSIVIRILVWEAKLILWKYKPEVILVTGSVGKTSAKDATYTALKDTHFVRKSEKSFNSDIGAPLTVLGVPNGWANPVRWARNIVDGLFLIFLKAQYPKWLILEVGADRPGDITRSLSRLRPTVVVATRFPAVSVHVEYYDSPQAVQEEELAPVGWLRPGGTLVGNYDDELVRTATLPDGVLRLLYGIHGGDLRASGIRTTVTKGMPRGTSFDVVYKGDKTRIILDGVVGEAHIYAVLAGIAAALAIGVPLAQAAGPFSMHLPPPGRMRLVMGMNDSVLIDDSYNSSPVAVAEALKALQSVPRKARRVAVLGDMLELGPYSVAEHEKAGALAATSAELLVTVGVRARGILAGAEKAGMPQERMLQFDSSSAAAEHLAGIVGEGDVVLIKGSQSIRMERVTKRLMARPEDAKKLLPRQDSEWLAR